MNTKAKLISWFIAAAVTTAQATTISYSFTNLAGMPGGSGNADGTGPASRFNNPTSIVADSAGNVYVADAGNRAIRQIKIGGATVTIAGGPTAKLVAPTGIAIDAAGNLYIADYGADTIRKLAPPTGTSTTWTLSTIAGIAGTAGHVDGSAARAQFSSPYGIAVDASSNVYVTDVGNLCVRKITSTGVVSTLISNYYGTNLNHYTYPPYATDNEVFRQPSGIAVGPDQSIWVADFEYGEVYKFTSSGEYLTQISHGNPTGITVDENGYVYVLSQDDGYLYVYYPFESTYDEYDSFGGNYADNVYEDFEEANGVAVDQRGDIFVADSGENVIFEIPYFEDQNHRPTVLLGGSVEQYGNEDGIGTNAYFDEPEGLAVDSYSNVYVADTGNNEIRMINPFGQSTYVGSYDVAGFKNGIGRNANLDLPEGLAMTTSGILFVTDRGDERIQEILPNGKVVTYWREEYDGDDGDPTGLALDPAGNLYFTDPGDYFEYAAEISPQGVETILSAFPENESLEGIAVSSSSNVYLVANSTVYVGPAGGPATVLVTNAYSFSIPIGVALDSANNVYVANSNGNTIAMITPSGYATNIAGTGALGFANAVGSNATFSHPIGVAVDTNGNIFVTDSGNNSIREITPAGPWTVSTIAGGGASGSTSGSSNGIGTNALFDYPTFIIVNPTNSGILYVSDTGNDTVRQLTLTATNWVVTTILGVAGESSAVAHFNHPSDVSVDAAGNAYVADTGNNAIRLISLGGYVSTIAGNDEIGYYDGVSNNAEFYSPSGVSADNNSNVFVADTFNHTIRKISLVSNTWTVSTIAGSPGYIGTASGSGTNARFNYPSGIAVDGTGTNVFVADTGNNLIRVIQSNSTGWTVTTIAGSGKAGTNDGVGVAALFNHPVGVAVYTTSNADYVYVSDSYNQTIRLLTYNGTAFVSTTVAGSPGIIGGGVILGLNGIGGGAEFDYPMGVAVDSTGNVLVADTGNNRVTQDLVTGRYEGDNYNTPITFASAGAIGGSTLGITLSLPSTTPKDGLILLVSGSGQIQHENWSDLVPGHTYTVTAVAAAGNVFSGWISGSTVTESYSQINQPATYKFIMQPGLVLEATFKATPFGAAAGQYNGLFANVDGNVTENSSGMIKDLIVTKTGSYSGTVLYNGASYAISGSFGANGTATKEIAHAKGGPITVTLSLSSPNITGTVNGSDWSASLTAVPAGGSHSGSFGMTVLASGSQSAPSNDGAGMIADSTGPAKITGTLADGTRFSESVPVSASGEVPIYANLYNDQGLVLGWINVDSDDDAGLAWIHPALKSGAFTQSFTTTNTVILTPQ